MTHTYTEVSVRFSLNLGLQGHITTDKKLTYVHWVLIIQTNNITDRQSQKDRKGSFLSPFLTRLTDDIKFVTLYVSKCDKLNLKHRSVTPSTILKVKSLVLWLPDSEFMHQVCKSNIRLLDFVFTFTQTAPSIKGFYRGFPGISGLGYQCWNLPGRSALKTTGTLTKIGYLPSPSIW